MSDDSVTRHKVFAREPILISFVRQTDKLNFWVTEFEIERL